MRLWSAEKTLARASGTLLLSKTHSPCGSCIYTQHILKYIALLYSCENRRGGTETHARKALSFIISTDEGATQPLLRKGKTDCGLWVFASLYSYLYIYIYIILTVSEFTSDLMHIVNFSVTNKPSANHSIFHMKFISKSQLFYIYTYWAICLIL